MSGKGKVKVVVGGQFGSEGKGHVAAKLCDTPARVAAVRVAGPNAGHSAVAPNGVKWALRQVPVAAVVNPGAALIIAAGSEIDEVVLTDELKRLDDAGYQASHRLFVDGQATVLMPEHIERECDQGLSARIGSTSKGIGAARAARIMRETPIWGWGMDSLKVADTAHMLAAWLRSGKDVVIEGTQGYGLGLHAGHYPKCTSSDCRAIDFLAMSGVSPWAPWVEELEVWVVLRTFPIRVAGNSGDLLHEVSWEQLARESGDYIRPEYTTVTNKERRVGRWDSGLAARAVMENGGPGVKVALTFFDYWFPELHNSTDPGDVKGRHAQAVAEIEKQIGASVQMLGTGPNTMIDLRG